MIGLPVSVVLSPYMDVSVVNPFLNASIQLFKNMFGITPTYGKPYVVEPAPSHRWEISGVIGITGDHEGVIVFRITRVLAKKLLEMSGVEVTDPTETPQVIREMVGELTNIISGNALPDCSDKNIDITPPAVVQGKDHNISWRCSCPIIGVPFNTKYGPFEVHICLSS